MVYTMTDIDKSRVGVPAKVLLITKSTTKYLKAKHMRMNVLLSVTRTQVVRDFILIRKGKIVGNGQKAKI